MDMLFSDLSVVVDVIELRLDQLLVGIHPSFSRMSLPRANILPAAHARLAITRFVSTLELYFTGRCN